MRCTAEDWENAKTIPELWCLCVFRDCQADISAAATKARMAIHDRYLARTMTLEEALSALSNVLHTESDAYVKCSDDHLRCKEEEPRPRKPLSDSQKAKMKNDSRSEFLQGVVIGLAGLAVTRIPVPGSVIIGGGVTMIGVAISVASNALATVASDPIDENFLEIAEPVPIHLPEVTADEFISEALATALNELLHNQASGISLGTALSSSLDRLQGAAIAGNIEAENRQLAAARDYALQWADIIRANAGLRYKAAWHLSAMNHDRPLCSNGTKTWEVSLCVLFIGITEWTQTTARNGFRQGEGVTPLEVNMLVDQR
jgi:hypothetical protein